MTVAYSGFFAAALIALILTISSVFFLGKRGPWDSLWTFFLVLFLTLWTVSIYVAPIGPVYWGIAWIPLVIAGLIITALLIAAMPNVDTAYSDPDVDVSGTREKGNETNRGAGKFFWVLIVLFVIAIIIGMVNPQKAL